MSLGRRFAGLLLCTSVLAFGSRHALAQTVVEIAPLVAYYAPSGNTINDGPNTPSNFSTPMLGAQVSAWSPYRVGVRLEATVGWKSAIGGPPALDGSVRTGYQDHRHQKDIVAYAAFAWTPR